MLAAMLATVLVVSRILPADSVLGQQVDARLKDVGIYTETPVHDQPFYALKQRALYPSDGRVTIYTEWLLPQPGHYTVRYLVYNSFGVRYVSNTHPFEASNQTWPTWFAFDIPKGEKAKALVGQWKVEIFLNADRLATLHFELINQNRRIESGVSIAVFPYAVQDETKDDEPAVTSERAEILKTSASYLASELRRIFVRVIPPQQSRPFLGEDFAPADVEKPGRLLRIRERLGAEVAIAGRVVVPAAGTGKATLEVTLVNLSTGLVERFRATQPEEQVGMNPRDLMEGLTRAMLAQPSFLVSVRTQAGGLPRATPSEPPSAPAVVADAPPVPSPVESRGLKGIPEIVKEQADAVVFIRVTAKDGERRLGTGVIVRRTGEILTNFHLMENAKTLTVKLRNEDVYDQVTVLETDPRRDIALIKVRGWNLPVVMLGNSDLIQVGERVVAIGNPKGLEQTVTDGLISAIRDTGKGYKLFQVSVPISTGSSGGPLFNMAGEAIGITAAYLEGGQNLNFAIPINYGLALLRDPAPPEKGTLLAPSATPSGVIR
jgi:hypothetical protein